MAELLPVVTDIVNYQHLAEHLRLATRDGRLCPGDLLPGAAELAQQTGLARSTVHRAITLLGQEGVISKIGNRWTVRCPDPQSSETVVGNL